MYPLHSVSEGRTHHCYYSLLSGRARMCKVLQVLLTWSPSGLRSSGPSHMLPLLPGKCFLNCVLSLLWFQVSFRVELMHLTSQVPPAARLPSRSSLLLMLILHGNSNSINCAINCSISIFPKGVSFQRGKPNPGSPESNASWSEVELI